MTASQLVQPRIASKVEWLEAREALLNKEKEVTKALDALAAERRRLPMVPVEDDYKFSGPDGEVSLIEMFDGRRQLIVYHFMFEAGGNPCIGCSSVADNIGPNLAHVNARDTTFVFTSPASQDEIIALQARMGWKAPWYTDHKRRFADAFGAGKGFGVNVFFRDDENRVYRSYFTTNRGGELFDNHFRLLDLTPYGRQEFWEDSPEGWPQTAPYEWWRMHNEYEEEK